jgi:hypothetical protein
MPIDAARTAFEHGRAGTLARRAAEARFGAAEQALQRRARNAVVDGVDDSARGVATVEQGGRPAQHLEALDDQWVDCRCVVEAEARCIDRRIAVVEQADAVAVKAADHRPAGLGAEAGGGHPGQMAQAVAERALPCSCQLITGQDRAGLGDLAAQGVAGDDDGLDGLG